MTESIPQGYKQTEIGVIPEDWEALPLGNLVEIKKGSLITSSTLSKGDIPVIAGGKQPAYYHNMANRFGSCVTISASGANAGFVNFFSEPIFASDCSTIEENKNISLRFIYYQLKLIQNRIYYLQTGGAQPHIHPSDIKPLIFPFPKKQEQIAIAIALSETDELIQQLDKLMTKKKDIKKGAMQELLTGKKRLPGFSGEWEEKKMRQIGNTFGGLSGKTKSDFGKGNSKYIPFMNIMNNPVIDIEYTDKVMIKSGEVQNKAKKGDLFFNGSSETPEEVGMCSVLLKDIPNLYLNSFCFGFRLNDQKETNGLFLSYYFRSDEGRNIFYSLSQGATRYNLSKTKFMEIKIPQPKPEEQSAIASILSDMDSEIEELEQKRNKYQMIKEGMMQQLLTGRIRLKWK